MGTFGMHSAAGAPPFTIVGQSAQEDLGQIYTGCLTLGHGIHCTGSQTENKREKGGEEA